MVHHAQDSEGELTPEAIESGRLLFAGSCEFIAAANNMHVLPPEGLPEICFAGRSNVGKSSLINALTGRRALARTSQTPGRTRQLIFFDLAGRLQLVDLPGYGYASAPKTDIKAWTTLTRKFLAGRASLQRVFLLVDSRRGIGSADSVGAATVGLARSPRAHSRRRALHTVRLAERPAMVTCRSAAGRS